MNPALRMVLFATGSLLIIGGTLGWVLGGLSMPAGIGLVAIGCVLESVAVLLYVRQRKPQG
jgi:hypothetical protein